MMDQGNCNQTKPNYIFYLFLTAPPPNVAVCSDSRVKKEAGGREGGTYICAYVYIRMYVGTYVCIGREVCRYICVCI